MKVLYINSNYITTALHQTMIKEMEALGIKSTVFASVRDGQECVAELHENVLAVPCYKKRHRYFFRWKQKKIIQCIEKRVNLKEYDIIHANMLFNDGYSACKLSKQHGIPYVVAVRNTDLNYYFKTKKKFRRLGVALLENAAAVFFLSESYRDAILNQYVPETKREIIRQKSYIIPNGIDNFWLSNIYTQRDFETSINRIAKKELNVLCVGQILKNKNIPKLQEALKLLDSEGWNVHLTVVGKAIDEKELQTIESDARTTYHSPVPKETLIDFYRKADIFALASHHETFGLVYAEAMSQGLPVIYTKGQGFDGQFPEGMVGYCVDDESVEDIAEKIEKICEDYAILAKNCVDLVTKYCWEDICKQYEQIYEKSIVK